ncbi:MAG: hypothetical protein GAK34_01693 [Delftia tsuruhatensis]|nr:MAG: hypothetical protein GAK34_01693 [Delftia tsuruhatensis]
MRSARSPDTGRYQARSPPSAAGTGRWLACGSPVADRHGAGFPAGPGNRSAAARLRGRRPPARTVPARCTARPGCCSTWHRCGCPARRARPPGRLPACRRWRSAPDSVRRVWSAGARFPAGLLHPCRGASTCPRSRRPCSSRVPPGYQPTRDRKRCCARARHAPSRKCGLASPPGAARHETCGRRPARARVRPANSGHCPNSGVHRHCLVTLPVRAAPIRRPGAMPYRGPR